MVVVFAVSEDLRFDDDVFSCETGCCFLVVAVVLVEAPRPPAAATAPATPPKSSSLACLGLSADRVATILSGNPDVFELYVLSTILSDNVVLVVTE